MVALSTTEAEYMALTKVVKETIWLGDYWMTWGLVRSKSLFIMIVTALFV